MGESAANRWFYECDDDFIISYKQKVKNHFKIITRINPDNKEAVKKFKELFTDCLMNRRENKDDGENVKKYEWDLTPYDNSHYGDEYNFISFIIVDKEANLNKIFDIMKSNFDNVFIRKSNKTYTLKIEVPVIQRGIWRSDDDVLLENKPKYPIVIVSYGRANNYGRTHLFLTKCKINHYIVVEKDEYEDYKKWIDPEYCEVINSKENFHTQGMGSTPVRNFVLKHFIRNGRVWMLDDNIKSYKRLYKGVKNEIQSNEIFTSIEKYVDSYNNVGIASHNFSPFVVEGGKRSIICKNGKCYSSMLIPTIDDIIFKHKHQEDNLISIEYIERGMCNLCFNHISYDKNTSGDDGGGNTIHIYKANQNNIGRKERYDYFVKIIESYVKDGKITPKEGKTAEDLYFHKPLKHEYWHIEFMYNCLMNYSINDIEKKPYDPHGYKYTLYLDTENYKTKPKKPTSPRKKPVLQIDTDTEDDSSVVLECNCNNGWLHTITGDVLPCPNCDIGIREIDTEADLAEAYREGGKYMLEMIISKLPHLELEILKAIDLKELLEDEEVNVVISP